MKNSKFFKPKKIIDPYTGKSRIVTSEEQIEMMEKGILFDVPSEEAKNEKDDNNYNSE